MRRKWISPYTYPTTTSEVSLVHLRTRLTSAKPPLGTGKWTPIPSMSTACRVSSLSGGTAPWFTKCTASYLVGFSCSFGRELVSIFSLLCLWKPRLRERMELVHSHSSLKASLGFIRWGQRHRLADSWVWIPTWSLPIWTTLHKTRGPHKPDSLSSDKIRVAMTAFLTDLGKVK